MATNHNPANTNNERNAYWWEQAADCVNTLAAFLRSKQRNLTMPGVNLEHVAPIFGANHSTTFTRAQARKAAVEMLFHRAGRKDSTHIPMSRRELAQCGDRALAGWLVEESSTKNGGTRPIVVRALDGYDGKGARYEAQIAVSGIGFTVKGVSGTFHSKKQAIKIAARNHFTDEWKAANEIDCQETRNAIKAQALADGLVSKNGVVIQPKQKKAAPAPVAQQSIASAVVTADQAKKMASAMGATGADIKTKKAAIAYLESIGISL
jgi:hypothetical protein